MKRMAIVATIAAAMLLSAVSFAAADDASYSGSSSASGDVTVKAKVNPKITLTVTTPDAGQVVDFGTVDPGSYSGESVSLSVNSNKQFDLVASQDTASFGGISLTRSLGAGESNIAKGASIARTDNYSINVPWTVDPDVDYTATVTYTVTQD